MWLRELIRFSSRKVELQRFVNGLCGSYSQYGEDLIVDKLLGHQKKGFYVDIGANHPFKFNNTFMFYKRGWRGINVDPNPSTKMIFDAIRPNDFTYNCGIAKKAGLLTFHIFADNMYSTFSDKEALQNLRDGKQLIHSLKVDVLPLKSLLRSVDCRKIDFLSVDTEGFDFEVLKSNDWTKYKPTVICVEGHDDIADIKKFLVEKGYICKFSETNSIFMLEGA